LSAIKKNTISKTAWHPWFWWVLLGLGIAYYTGRTRGINFGDAVIFVTCVQAGPDMGTNATAHFLYNTLLGLTLPHVCSNCQTELPALMVLVSIVFSLLALWQFYKLAYRLTTSAQASLLAVVLQSLAFTWFRQTVIIEVYTAGTFLLLLTLNPLIADLKANPYEEENPHFGNIYKVSVLYGLTLLLHIQHILLMPLFIWYLYRCKNIAKAMLALFILFLVTAILWISPLLWHVNTFASILFDDLLGKTWLIPPINYILKNMAEALVYLGYNFHVFLIPIGYGLLLAWKKKRELFVCLVFTASLYVAYCLRAVLADIYVFYLVPNTILALFATYAFKEILNRQWLNFRLWLLVLIALPPLFYFSAWKIAAQVPAIAAYGHKKDYKGGLRYLMLPWMNNNPDLVYNTRKVYYSHCVPDNFIEFYWNYQAGLPFIIGKPDPVNYQWDNNTERLKSPNLPVYNPSGEIE
jgi:hypothetical protein